MIRPLCLLSVPLLMNLLYKMFPLKGIPPKNEAQCRGSWHHFRPWFFVLLTSMLTGWPSISFAGSGCNRGLHSSSYCKKLAAFSSKFSRPWSYLITVFGSLCPLIICTCL